MFLLFRNNASRFLIKKWGQFFLLCLSPLSSMGNWGKNYVVATNQQTVSESIDPMSGHKKLPDTPSNLPNKKLFLKTRFYRYCLAPTYTFGKFFFKYIFALIAGFVIEWLVFSLIAMQHVFYEQRRINSLLQTNTLKQKVKLALEEELKGLNEHAFKSVCEVLSPWYWQCRMNKAQGVKTERVHTAKVQGTPIKSADLEGPFFFFPNYRLTRLYLLLTMPSQFLVTCLAYVNVPDIERNYIVDLNASVPLKIHIEYCVLGFALTVPRFLLNSLYGYWLMKLLYQLPVFCKKSISFLSPLLKTSSLPDLASLLLIQHTLTQQAAASAYNTLSQLPLSYFMLFVCVACILVVDLAVYVEKYLIGLFTLYQQWVAYKRLIKEKTENNGLITALLESVKNPYKIAKNAFNETEFCVACQPNNARKSAQKKINCYTPNGKKDAICFNCYTHWRDKRLIKEKTENNGLITALLESVKNPYKIAKNTFNRTEFCVACQPKNARTGAKKKPNCYTPNGKHDAICFNCYTHWRDKTVLQKIIEDKTPTGKADFSLRKICIPCSYKAHNYVTYQDNCYKTEFEGPCSICHDCFEKRNERDSFAKNFFDNMGRAFSGTKYPVPVNLTATLGNNTQKERIGRDGELLNLNPSFSYLTAGDLRGLQASDEQVKGYIAKVKALYIGGIGHSPLSGNKTCSFYEGVRTFHKKASLYAWHSGYEPLSIHLCKKLLTLCLYGNINKYIIRKLFDKGTETKKPCPYCGYLTEKDDHCDHISDCHKCHNEWCWQKGKEFKESLHSHSFLPRTYILNQALFPFQITNTLGDYIWFKSIYKFYGKSEHAPTSLTTRARFSLKSVYWLLVIALLGWALNNNSNKELFRTHLQPVYFSLSKHLKGYK